jgi:hypothetical protein
VQRDDVVPRTANTSTSSALLCSLRSQEGAAQIGAALLRKHEQSPVVTAAYQPHDKSENHVASDSAILDAIDAPASGEVAFITNGRNFGLSEQAASLRLVTGLFGATCVSIGCLECIG